ncbi:hypothetical protein [Thiomonas sp.]|uniref:hypothetical protein n=1 Tax=Thiomonas sp. TaxID=2047785 RepID=UPI0025857EC7|nr:hypothetical protein [Thiomonas sp.]
MKQPFLPLIAAIVLGASLPALAGPDFQAIEKARAGRQAANTSRVDRSNGQRVNCPPESLVLPLDHGPRAQTTPGENRMRKARHEAQVKACTNPES